MNVTYRLEEVARILRTAVRRVPARELFDERRAPKPQVAVWMSPSKATVRAVDPILDETVETTIRPYVIITRKKAILAPPEQPAREVITQIIASGSPP